MTGGLDLKAVYRWKHFPLESSHSQNLTKRDATHSHSSVTQPTAGSCHSTMHQLKKIRICIPKKVLRDRQVGSAHGEHSFTRSPSEDGSQGPLSSSYSQKDKMVLLMISTDSRISSSLITSGGANLMISPWVGLARSPLSRSRRHTLQASQSLVSLMTMAFSNPFPLTAVTTSEGSFISSFLKMAPILSAFSARFSSSKTSRAAMAIRQPSGLPPYVEPCSPGLMVSMISSSHSTADTGYKPPERAFPRRTMSGLTFSWSTASHLPVLDSPVCISSAINRTWEK